MPRDFTRPHNLPPARALVGPYRIETLLGEGGMSTVHLGRHCSIGRRAAIKIMRSDLCSDPSMVSRFLNEARLLSRVHHPNVVAIEGFGRTPWGAPYMVMEYLEGVDLQTRLEQCGHLPWSETRVIARQLLLALRAIHSEGIVHRDIKPQNCLMVARDDGVCLKLVDFGISKSTVGDVTTTTSPDVVLGTPCYMAPEQACAGLVDARTDLYAAGVMLFELSAGKPPFVASTPTELIAQHLRDAPPSVFDVYPDCDAPRWFDAFVQRTLAKQGADRFASAREMLDVLAERAGQTRSRVRTEPPAADPRRRGSRAIIVTAAVACSSLLAFAAYELASPRPRAPSSLAPVIEHDAPRGLPTGVTVPMQPRESDPRLTTKRPPPLSPSVLEPQTRRPRTSRSHAAGWRAPARTDGAEDDRKGQAVDEADSSGPSTSAEPPAQVVPLPSVEHTVADPGTDGAGP